MVERTHANTPAKSKTNKKNKSYRNYEIATWEKRIRHPECMSCRFWFFWFCFDLAGVFAWVLSTMFGFFVFLLISSGVLLFLYIVVVGDFQTAGGISRRIACVIWIRNRNQIRAGLIVIRNRKQIRVRDWFRLETRIKYVCGLDWNMEPDFHSLSPLKSKWVSIAKQETGS